MTEEMEEVMVITITSPDGEEKDFQEVDAVEIDGKIFSLLLEICENEDEAEAIIARVDEEDGEPVYVEPTEEEFEAASKAFEELAAEDEEE
ncbi:MULTISPECIES: DUF1292 domain-containing protein [Megasphaera]|jgi:uncharacterized protein YrzB (UPF0473 family)|nr:MULTISPECIES: DUF1292 domain-containing protein [Megasphaera]MDN0045876.1 DUF1292 domain-containing protein [Megasphaera hexanoica]NJE34913.1 DUF1292 domain-containing protein [Megasphaera sp. SW808]